MLGDHRTAFVSNISNTDQTRTASSGPPAASIFSRCSTSWKPRYLRGSGKPTGGGVSMILTGSLYALVA